MGLERAIRKCADMNIDVVFYNSTEEDGTVKRYVSVGTGEDKQTAELTDNVMADLGNTVHRLMVDYVALAVGV